MEGEEPRRKSPRKLGPPGQEAAESEPEGSTPSGSDEEFVCSDDEGMTLSALAGSTPGQPVSLDEE